MILADHEIVPVMIGARPKQQDMLSGKFLARCRERSGSTPYQTPAWIRKTQSHLWAHGSIQEVYSANELGRDPWPHACGGPAWPRAVHPTKTCFIGDMIRKRRPLARRFAGLSYRFRKPFFKAICARYPGQDNRARHQLAPVVAVQKILDRAVAGRVPDGLFIRRF